MKIMTFDTQQQAYDLLLDRYDSGLVDEILFYSINVCIDVQGSLPTLGMDDGNVQYQYPIDDTLTEYQGTFMTIKDKLH